MLFEESEIALLAVGSMVSTAEQMCIRDRYRLRLRLHDPKRQVNEKRQRLISAQDDLKRLMEKRLSEYRQRLALLSGRLEGCSPLKKLSQGFGFVTDEAGKRVDSVNKVCLLYTSNAVTRNPAAALW